MATEDILKDVNLRFVSDKKPGFTRKVIGKKFVYFDKEGKRITDQATIDRINKLVIPPAYTNVWICPSTNGYLQAVGYDDRKRKQYRYHPLWIKTSQKEKFTHMKHFAQDLPKIRSKLKYYMEKPGMPKEKISVKNKRVARIIRRCKEIPGQDLFEYLDDKGEIQSVDSYDVNEYLKEITGEEITAKDFRTWGGTVLAAATFDKLGISKEENVIKQNVVDTFKEVALFLGNRPATVRKYYVHPAIIEAYSKGYVTSNIEKLSKRKFESIEGLYVQENSVLALLSYMSNR